MNNSYRISELIAKKIKGEISDNELIELNSWIEESPDNRSVYEKSIDTKKQVEKLKDYKSYNSEKVWGNIEDELFKTKTISLQKNILRYAAAIILPLFIAGLAYNYFSPSNENALAAIDENIKPGIQKAVLILSDGGQVDLTIESNELKEKGVKIDNKQSKLHYQVEDEVKQKQELVFNELKTPKGGGYNLKLSDGTEVWVNAGSTLKFPVNFTEETREVYLTGEAYFKVTHNGKPFIVKSGSTDIHVLGTSFNVSAYNDEQQVTTTLVEGKVQVEVNDTNTILNTILTPGMQAVFDKSSEEVVVNNVVTSQYTSWIDGKLEFSNQELDLVMKRLSRWYDFEYSFKNEKAKKYHFSARFNNDESISTILEMLEMSAKIKFEMRNNTIVIL